MSGPAPGRMLLSEGAPAGPPLRIGLVCVYFGLFDEAMPPEFRAERTAVAERMRERLERMGEVVYPGLVDSEEAGRAAAARFAEQPVDAIVFAPTMAAPPGYGWEAIRELGDVPVIAVGEQELEAVPDDYHTEEATRRSLTVGLPMFTNVLVRFKRPFIAIFGHSRMPDMDKAIGNALSAAAAAAAVRGSRLLAVGEPIPGYLDVETTPSALASLGVEIAAVDADGIGGAYEAVDGSAVRELAGRIRGSCHLEAVDDAVLERSARLALALENLCAEHGAAGGAVNCHGEALRRNPRVGITACLGVTRCSEMGKPFACTGDIPAGIALLIGKKLAGAALYCELYQLDFTGDWVLAANGGEGDPAIRRDGAPLRLLPEDHYLGEEGPGVAAAFELPAGPATLMSLTHLNHSDGWSLTAAEGKIVGSRHHRMDGPNGMFRFESGSVANGYVRWCAAGATHHAVLIPGHRGKDLHNVSKFLKIGFRSV